jgi:hypothetical protein
VKGSLRGFELNLVFVPPEEGHVIVDREVREGVYVHLKSDQPPDEETRFVADADLVELICPGSHVNGEFLMQENEFCCPICSQWFHTLSGMMPEHTCDKLDGSSVERAQALLDQQAGGTPWPG